MQTETAVAPWWAALTVWGVVNAINLLQAAGFLSRVFTGSRAINHALGYVMIALALPAAAALVALARAGAGWRQWIGAANLSCDRFYVCLGEMSSVGRPLARNVEIASLLLADAHSDRTFDTGRISY